MKLKGHISLLLLALLFGLSRSQDSDEDYDSSEDYPDYPPEILHSCPEPFLLNGDYTPIEQGYQAECFPGFRLIGDEILLCDSDTGSYFNPEPRCEDINECAFFKRQDSSSEDSRSDEQVSGDGAGGDDEDMWNGEEQPTPCSPFAKCQDTPGSYTCTCRGKYYGDGYVCHKREKCSEPEGTHPVIVKYYDQFTGRLRLGCADGFVPFGKITLQCLPNGTWNHPLPQCRPHTPVEHGCGDPGTPKNGRYYGNNFKNGGWVKYVCDDGYRMVGHDERTCVEGYGWTNPRPRCEAKLGLGDVAIDLRRNFVDNYVDFSPRENRTGLTGLVALSVDRGLDIIFFLDCSHSVDKRDLRDGINFIKKMLTVFEAGKGADATKITLYTVGTDATLLIRNEPLSRRNKIDNAMDAIEPYQGSTDMDGVFKLMRKNFRTRSDAKRVLFIVSDGIYDGQFDAVRSHAAYVKSRLDLEIYAIGIGASVKRRMLKHIVSQPKDEHLFILENYAQFSDLSNLLVNVQPEEELCGTPRHREGRQHGGSLISGGVPVHQGDWPWLALVYVSGKFHCGATLICKNWVLTSARCLEENSTGVVRMVDKYEISIDLGVNNRLDPSESVQKFAVSEVHFHPDHTLGSIDRDVALVKLEEDATLNKYVRTVCVAKPTDPRRILNIGRKPKSKTVIVGWGQTKYDKFEQSDASTPNELYVGVETNANCKDQLDYMGISEDMQTHLFCAGVRQSTSGACWGDNGGPLVHRDGTTGRWLVVGVLSAPYGCSERFKLGVYVDVLPLSNWISETTGSCVKAVHDGDGL